MYYFTFELDIQSNLTIRDLQSHLYTASKYLKIQFGEAFSHPNSESIYYDQRAGLNVWKADNTERFRFLYSDGTEFVIDLDSGQLWATWADDLTFEDTLTYFLGPVLGFILRLKNIVCLHASAIAVDGQAIVVFGVSGAGKSTTAAAFAKLGFPILSDDIVALDDLQTQFMVRPAYPRIRLWEQSVEMLFGSPDALPRLTPNWDKRYLDLREDGYQFQDEPLPLGAIYILDERSEDEQAPYCESIPANEALIKLVSNTYANYLLDKDRRKHEFEVLGRIIDYVPIRKVIPHQDPARLMNLCDTILDDYRNKVKRV